MALKIFTLLVLASAILMPEQKGHALDDFDDMREEDHDAPPGTVSPGEEHGLPAENEASFAEVSTAASLAALEEQLAEQVAAIAETHSKIEALKAKPVFGINGDIPSHGNNYVPMEGEGGAYEEEDVAIESEEEAQAALQTVAESRVWAGAFGCGIHADNYLFHDGFTGECSKYYECADLFCTKHRYCYHPKANFVEGEDGIPRPGEGQKANVNRLTGKVHCDGTFGRECQEIHDDCVTTAASGSAVDKGLKFAQHGCKSIKEDNVNRNGTCSEYFEKVEGTEKFVQCYNPDPDVSPNKPGNKNAKMGWGWDAHKIICSGEGGDSVTYTPMSKHCPGTMSGSCLDNTNLGPNKSPVISK